MDSSDATPDQNLAKTPAVAFDLLIIGAGTAGLTAALYALRAKKTVLLLEKSAVGGQILETTQIENFPATPGVSGPDFVKSLKTQVKNLGGVISFAEVEKIEKADKIFRLQTDSGNFSGKTIILATGSAPKKLGLENEEEFLNRGLSHCATCDGPLYKDKVITVYGGGNSALFSALYLAPLAKKLYLIHRRTEFRADAALVEKLKSKNNVELILGETIESLNGTEKLASLTLKSGRELKTDALFICLGRTPDTKIVKNLIDLDSDGYVLSDETCRTTLEGLFCAGDCRKKPLHQLVTAAADGATAASAAVAYLNQPL